MLTVNPKLYGPVRAETELRLAALPDRVKGFYAGHHIDTFPVSWVQRFTVIEVSGPAEVIRLEFGSGVVHEWVGVQGSWNSVPSVTVKEE